MFIKLKEPFLASGIFCEVVRDSTWLRIINTNLMHNAEQSSMIYSPSRWYLSRRHTFEDVKYDLHKTYCDFKETDNVLDLKSQEEIGYYITLSNYDIVERLPDDIKMKALFNLDLIIGV